MTPTIIPNDKVLFVKVNSIDELNSGDILVFAMNRRYIAHRILKKTRTSILTKGDNELFPDPLLTSKSIVGKVVAVVRNKTVYDHTTVSARLYNYYCLLYSYSIYLSHKFIVNFYPKFLFRGRKFLLFLLQQKGNKNG